MSSSAVEVLSGHESAEGDGAGREFARYLPHLGRMSTQLKQTSAQIEESVVGVCRSFDGIAARARATVSRATGFLGRDASASGGPSFEHLIEACSGTLVKIMNTTNEAANISRRAIERVEQMDAASKQISIALGRLDNIANENKLLALNARIEAAHAGAEGVGFAVVAVELAAQTLKSRNVTAHVADLAANLRALAESTLTDLRRMIQSDQERVQQCRVEVDESLRGLTSAHGAMEEMLSGMTSEGAMLATEIGSAVRGMQFQDRVSQRIAHVVEDLETLQDRLVTHFGTVTAGDAAADEGFSAYTMQEERQVAGNAADEASAGDVELF